MRGFCIVGRKGHGASCSRLRVDAFPGEAVVAERSDAGALLVGPAVRGGQAEALDDGGGPPVEGLGDQAREPAVGLGVGVLGVDPDRTGLGHADGVADEDLGRGHVPVPDQPLGHVVRHVRAAAVDLARVLARERSTSDRLGVPALVHHDLAADDPGVRQEAADGEPAGAVDHEVFRDVPEDRGDRTFGQRRAHRLDVHVRGVHGRDDRAGDQALVQDDLDLDVRAEPRQLRAEHGGGQGIAQLAGDLHRRVKARRGRGGEEPPHAALVTGATGVHALRDVRALRLDVVDDLDRVGVADVRDHAVDDHRDVDVGHGRDLAADHERVVLAEHLQRDTGSGVLGQHGVQKSVCARVTDLVRVAGSDELGSSSCSRKKHRSFEPPVVAPFQRKELLCWTQSRHDGGDTCVFTRVLGLYVFREKAPVVNPLCSRSTLFRPGVIHRRRQYNTFYLRGKEW